MPTVKPFSRVFNNINPIPCIAFSPVKVVPCAQGGCIAGGDGWPYVQHTMAADLNVNPLGTRYYLDWGEGNTWNGIYVVEDTGEGLHGWHLDIYTGFGTSDMLAAPIDLYVNVYTATC